MYRFLALFLAINIFVSCSKDDESSPSTPAKIPDVINGYVTEFTVAPIDINTPDKGSFLINSNGVIYKVEFDAAADSGSNAILLFNSDTILTDQSREFANLGKDAVAYNPVADNQILVEFHDGTGRKIDGLFNAYTSFGGTFGQDLISQWRDPADPAKPTQKAKDDIMNFVQRYADKDGPGPGTVPQSLLVTVSFR